MESTYRHTPVHMARSAQTQLTYTQSYFLKRKTGMYLCSFSIHLNLPQIDLKTTPQLLKAQGMAIPGYQFDYIRKELKLRGWAHLWAMLLIKSTEKERLTCNLGHAFCPQPLKGYKRERTGTGAYFFTKFQCPRKARRDSQPKGLSNYWLLGPSISTQSLLG